MQKRRIKANTGILIYEPNHPRAGYDGYVPEHILIAEKILGHPLRPLIVIHHPNGNQDNSIFVICENQAYHLFLHRRLRALIACGRPSWRKCKFCKEYDAPENLYIYKNGEYVNGGNVYHLKCVRDYRAQGYRRQTVKEVSNGSSISEPEGHSPEVSERADLGGGD